MAYVDLVVFLKNNFPDISQEICDCLEITIETINNAFKDFQSAIKIAHSNYNPEQVKTLTEKLCQLSSINENLNKYYEIVNNDNALQERCGKKEICKINYEDYQVDTKVPHRLNESFTWQRPIAFEFRNKKYNVKTWKDVFWELSNILYNIDNEIFFSFINDKEMQGKKRKYFQTNTEEMVRPKKLVDVNLYIETNMSANSIRDTIVKMLNKYEISIEEISIYIHKNYSSAHQK